MKKILLALVLLVILFITFEVVTFPNVAKLRDTNPKTTAFMEQRKKQLEREGKDATIEYRWVSYDRISPYLRRAVLVSEDNSFYEHEGLDEEGLREALRKNIEQKRISAGGSTITQQLAKNLYLSPSKNPYRKLKELLITKKLEQELSKKRILELYLNVVEFGERTYGAEAAARRFFRKSASSLTPSQAALLAGCLPNPRVMKVDAPDKRLKRRQRIILSRMRRWGYTMEREVLTSKPQKEEKVASPPATETSATASTETPPPPEVDTSVPEEPESDAAPEAPPTQTETTATQSEPLATETTATP